MDRWKGRVAVVTGASAGIGAAIAEDLVEGGMKVVALARRLDRLEEMKTRLQGKSGTLYPVKTDVSKDEEVVAAFNWIREHLGKVEVLVNNAAVFIMGRVTDGKIDDWRRIFEVNAFGVGSCSREAIKLMKEQKIDDGHIITINGVDAYNPTMAPFGYIFGTSKAACKHITDAIRKELIADKTKIKVSSVSPGAVKTEIIEANNKLEDFVKATGVDFGNIQWLEPKDIADAVRYVLSTPPNVQIEELIIRAVGDDF